jgi:membrane protein DedA with SNARE-associated domain/rhodanese-related sulfurtransferase
MHQTIEFLAKHGCWILFVAVLARQACLPVPANLLMLAAGALARLGRLSLVSIMTLSIAAFLLADFAWYEAGKRWGDRTLRFLCELARRPISYPNEIAATFHRYGVKWLLLSKFMIGLDAVAAPMCGISQVSAARFLVADAIGAGLWVLSYAAVGYIFSDRLDHIATYIGKMGTLAALSGTAGVCVYFLVKLVRHYRLLCELRLARITSEHLQSKLIAGENVLLLDLQGGEQHCQGLMGIPGAVRIDPRQLSRDGRPYRGAVATELEIILYGASLGGRTSVRAALALRRKGFECVRTLEGGLQAWRDCGFLVTRDVPMLPYAELAVYVLREVFRCSPATSAQIIKSTVADVQQLLEQADARLGTSKSFRQTFLEQCQRKDIADSICCAPVPTLEM